MCTRENAEGQCAKPSMECGTFCALAVSALALAAPLHMEYIVVILPNISNQPTLFFHLRISIV